MLLVVVVVVLFDCCCVYAFSTQLYTVASGVRLFILTWYLCVYLMYVYMLIHIKNYLKL